MVGVRAGVRPPAPMIKVGDEVRGNGLAGHTLGAPGRESMIKVGKAERCEGWLGTL